MKHPVYLCKVVLEGSLINFSSNLANWISINSVNLQHLRIVPFAIHLRENSNWVEPCTMLTFYQFNETGLKQFSSLLRTRTLPKRGRRKKSVKTMLSLYAAIIKSCRMRDSSSIRTYSHSLHTKARSLARIRYYGRLDQFGVSPISRSHVYIDVCWRHISTLFDDALFL